MIFELSFIVLVNVVILSAGIGVCLLNYWQVSVSPDLDRDFRRRFQAFFLALTVYVVGQLVKQTFNGCPGPGIHVFLSTAIFVMYLAAGLVPCIISLIMLSSARPENPRPCMAALIALTCVHTAIQFYNIFSRGMYYVNADNIYHRGPSYIFTQVCPVLMLLIDAGVLGRYGTSIHRRVRAAFWGYVCAPIAAIILQTLFIGFEFILFATISASVNLFLVMHRNQDEKYRAQRLENSRIETELSLAASIQSNMLPNTFPAYPQRREFDIYATTEPAKEMGGDFYDFFLVDEDHLALVMADVSGKGVPAALFMMTSRTMLKDADLGGSEPRPGPAPGQRSAVREQQGRHVCDGVAGDSGNLHGKADLRRRGP